MPAAAHFQVAKTVYDFIKFKNLDGATVNRREMIAELRPIMILLRRKESTVQSMLDSLIRIGAVGRNASRDYIVLKAFDMAEFAADVDRNVPRKMVITWTAGDPAIHSDEGDVDA